MIQAIALIVYVVFCPLVGLCGSQRRMGFIGTFIISLFVTPMAVLVVLLLTGPSSRVEWHRRPQSATRRAIECCLWPACLSSAFAGQGGRLKRMTSH